jgi:hypothetical protein
MKAPASKPKSDPFPAGTHNAVCYGVVDLGTQEVTFQGAKKMQRKLRIQWEVPALRVKYTKDDVEHEGPKVIGKTYTFSTFQKAALSQHLATWGITDIETFDFKTLIGRSCMLNVVQAVIEGGDTISYIGAVMQMPAGMPEMKVENPSLYYSIDEHGVNIPENIYGWLIESIKKSPEWAKLGQAPAEQMPTAEPEVDLSNAPDDIPF